MLILKKSNKENVAGQCSQKSATSLPTTKMLLPESNGLNVSDEECDCLSQFSLRIVQWRSYLLFQRCCYLLPRRVRGGRVTVISIS